MKLIKTKTASSFLYELIFFLGTKSWSLLPWPFTGYHFENTSQALFFTGKTLDKHKFSNGAKKTTMAL